MELKEAIEPYLYNPAHRKKTALSLTKVLAASLKSQIFLRVFGVFRHSSVGLIFN
jgi:hypothetical protein